MATDDHLAGVVRQRSQLGQAMQQVEMAAAAPAAKKSWIPDLTTNLRQLEVAFNQHMIDVQSPYGLLHQIVDQAPRLQRAVESSKEEHAQVARLIREALEFATEKDAADRVDAIREATMEALLALARHRQKGADLIYDAYDVDIGGY